MKMGILRFFHSGLCCRTASSSAMALLRKKTGYTFLNIRKALELNGNDIEKAEKWLAQQAKELGWSKAVKMQERKATEGLIGVAVENKKLAMVEVNCETDFVSKNEKFKSLVELVARTCLQQPVLAEGLDTQLMEMKSEEIGKLRANNHSLADHVALLIGSVGENTTLKRAFCFETTKKDVEIAFATHPASDSSEISLGKYASFISYQINPEVSCETDTSQVAVDICTHIIGMNPKKIGEYGKDEPSEIGDDETVLIHQDFLLNDTITVGQLLTDHGITILDFKRFQCGESGENEKCLENDGGAEVNKIKA